jgi:16S rRNA (uracil1498-N3)-methyltransferase
MFSGKNKIIGLVLDAKISTPITPSITLMPSLLKRDAFETVVYLAAQMGATIIQPLQTAKTHRSLNNEKEQARLTKIMIAACEQAKSFCIPELKNPIDINDLSKPPYGIYFEDDGTPLATISQKIITEKPKNLTLVFGPEGGLTMAERQHLDACGFTCCALTPTILRAQEAIAVGLGALRSLLSHNK